MHVRVDIPTTHGINFLGMTTCAPHCVALPRQYCQMWASKTDHDAMGDDFVLEYAVIHTYQTRDVCFQADADSIDYINVHQHEWL